MANVSRPKGLVPIRHIDGSPWNRQVTPFFLPTSDSTAVYIGDLVKTGGTSGAAGTFVNGVDVEGMQTCVRDVAGTTIVSTLGVVVGFSPNQDNLMQKYRAASTARIAYVVTDPTVVYEIQEDAATTPVAQASIGLNAAYATTAGSTTTGLSAVVLDSDTVATTATLPLKVLGLVKRPDNAFNTAGAGSDPATFEVMLNGGLLSPASVGA